MKHSGPAGPLTTLFAVNHTSSDLDSDRLPPAGVAEPATWDAVLGDFHELYRTMAPLVGRWAARLGGPGTDVDDVIQEVFLLAHREQHRFRGDSKLSSWLFGITRNVVRGQRRRERLRSLFALRHLPDVLPVAARPTPVEALERDDAARIVYRALAGLNEKQRTAFVLYEIEGLSGHEVAALMNLKGSTLRVILLRARQQFEQQIRSMGITS